MTLPDTSMVLLPDIPVERLVTRLSEFTLPVTRGTLVQQHTKFYREVQKTTGVGRTLRQGQRRRYVTCP